ncbi:MAG: hypothetical protein ACTS44_01135 [Candidatus Hodgkinia cicadicola]
MFWKVEILGDRLTSLKRILHFRFLRNDANGGRLYNFRRVEGKTCSPRPGEVHVSNVEKAREGAGTSFVFAWWAEVVLES